MASLLFALAAAVLCWRSYFVGYSISFMPGTPRYREFTINDEESGSLRTVRFQIGWEKTDDLAVANGRLFLEHGYADGRHDHWEFRAFDPATSLGTIPKARWAGIGWRRDYFFMALRTVCVILFIAPALCLFVVLRSNRLRAMRTPTLIVAPPHAESSQ